MTVILHASDIHFGKADTALTEELLGEINTRKPDLTILSGDFVQTGFASEFKQAQEFIARIKSPVLCVPGNHDIPRTQLFQRFFRPFRRYKKYINPETDPLYESDDLLVAGINTGRPVVPHWNWAHGMVGRNQVKRMHEIYKNAPSEKCRIVVCHHPLQHASGVPLKTIVWGGKDLSEALLALNVDLLLTGHVHHASVTLSEDHDSRLASIGAATATSTRLRDQANGYNLIHIGKDEICIDMMHWAKQGFEKLESHSVKRNHPGRQL
jgi:3',5'-cyclic AMP phosphodiesterase CpdA